VVYERRVLGGTSQIVVVPFSVFQKTVEEFTSKNIRQNCSVVSFVHYVGCLYDRRSYTRYASSRYLRIKDFPERFHAGRRAGKYDDVFGVMFVKKATVLIYNYFV
jgi:hypothetical protein